MQFRWRPIAPREIDHELLWLAVSLGGFFLAATWFALNLPTPQCAFHALTGFPCLTCGATRCALQFFHGRFASAWFFNPLAFLAYGGVIAFDLYAAAVLLLRAPRLRLTSSERARKMLRITAVTLVLANWSYLIFAGKV